MLTRRENPRVNSRVSRSREDWSAQWTSSTTSRIGDVGGQVVQGRVDGLDEVAAVDHRVSGVVGVGFGAAGRDEPRQPRVGLQDAVEHARARCSPGVRAPR